MSCNDMLRIDNKTGHDTLIWLVAIPGTLALPPWQDYDGIRIYPYSPRHGKFPGLDLMWYPCGFIGGLGAQVSALFLHRCVNNALMREICIFFPDIVLCCNSLWFSMIISTTLVYGTKLQSWLQWELVLVSTAGARSRSSKPILKAMLPRLGKT